MDAVLPEPPARGITGGRLNIRRPGVILERVAEALLDVRAHVRPEQVGPCAVGPERDGQNLGRPQDPERVVGPACDGTAVAGLRDFVLVRDPPPTGSATAFVRWLCDGMAGADRDAAS